MNLMSWLTITTSITLSTAMITTTTHWLMTWVCLEINTMSMTPIISKPNHPRATEAATKYFLTQTIASTTMLLSTTMNAMNTSNWEINMTTEPATTIITMTLLMKMAAAPFHFWLPEVSQGTTTLTTLTILTWQKIAPLSILLNMNNNTNTTILLTSAIMSIIIGSVGGLNQVQLRKLMAFSSITNTGWILSTITMAPNISLLTFMLYILTSIPILVTMNITSSVTMKDVGTTWTSSPTTMLIFSMTMLSMGGLPPTTGFMPKWLILNKMMFMNMTIEALTMAMTSLLSLYIYMRLMYISSTTMPPHNSITTMKWRMHNKYPMLNSTMTMISTLLLPLSPNM
uniref:NADH-ubiquinone oxidoreductase chain 2 n=3 Tax=Pseudagkistrodon rudis TaxID=2759634 RepID=A0A7T7CMW6_9SAUR|nr:NADH dehydrogenase subunit 2 [Pseudagkistrodon rudis]QQK90408.1 NADH dehydrogenase subunit 2 [Pseudagkistrodon rudis]QYC94118.1 NADH dehydrogenase subunit 2 [Pseudagkistrodon rudis]